MRYAGVDTHKRYSTIVLTDESGRDLLGRPCRITHPHSKISLVTVVSLRVPYWKPGATGMSFMTCWKV